MRATRLPQIDHDLGIAAAPHLCDPSYGWQANEQDDLCRPSQILVDVGRRCPDTASRFCRDFMLWIELPRACLIEGMLQPIEAAHSYHTDKSTRADYALGNDGENHAAE